MGLKIRRRKAYRFEPGPGYQLLKENGLQRNLQAGFDDPR